MTLANGLAYFVAEWVTTTKAKKFYNVGTAVAVAIRKGRRQRSRSNVVSPSKFWRRKRRKSWITVETSTPFSTRWPTTTSSSTAATPVRETTAATSGSGDPSPSCSVFKFGNFRRRTQSAKRGGCSSRPSGPRRRPRKWTASKKSASAPETEISKKKRFQQDRQFLLGQVTKLQNFLLL